MYYKKWGSHTFRSLLIEATWNDAEAAGVLNPTPSPTIKKNNRTALVANILYIYL